MTITARAIALLREYQWSVDSYGDVCCRCCGEPRDVGKHDIDCTLAALLAEYDRGAAASTRGEETERDAARYRWLVTNSVSRRNEHAPVLVTPWMFHQDNWPQQIDAHIDAAIAKEQAPHD